MFLLSVVTLSVFISFYSANAAEQLGNQSVRDILLKNQCLCPCSSTTGGEKSFLIPFDEANWFEAVSYCDQIGMAIVHIRDKYDTQDLQEWLADHGDGRSQGYWIGANDLARTGLYRWGLSNKPVRYRQWASGEPNGAKIRGEVEHCGELRADTMEWNDSLCSKSMKFICEKFN